MFGVIAKGVHQVINFHGIARSLRSSIEFCCFKVKVVGSAMFALSPDHLPVQKRNLFLGGLITLKPHFLGLIDLYREFWS